MEKQYQIRARAQNLLNDHDCGIVELSTTEKGYLAQAIQLFDMAIESGDLPPKHAIRYLTTALNRVIKGKVN